jgi:hypothetical protein
MSASFGYIRKHFLISGTIWAQKTVLTLPKVLYVEHPRFTDEQITKALNYSSTWVNKVRNSTIFQRQLNQFWEGIWRG